MSLEEHQEQQAPIPNQEEKQQEEQRRGEHRQEQQRREEQWMQEQRQEEQRREEQRREKQRQEEQRRQQQQTNNNTMAQQHSPSPKIVPGKKTYAEVITSEREDHMKTTLIFSDSTCRNIKTRALNQLIDKNKERVIVSQHPGAVTEQLGYYLGYHLDKQKIDRLVIVSGLNDLLYASNKPEPITNEHDMVNRVIKMAKYAKDSGVQEVYISSLFNVKNIDNKNIDIYNRILSRCDDFGIGYIFNSNIDLSDLYDGLHVNNTSGHSKLKHNLMQCFDTYVANFRNIDSIGN